MRRRSRSTTPVGAFSRAYASRSAGRSIQSNCDIYQRNPIAPIAKLTFTQSASHHICSFVSVWPSTNATRASSDFEDIAGFG